LKSIKKTGKTVKEVVNRLNKIYTRGDLFRAFMLGKEIIPLEINLKKITQKEIQKNFSTFMKNSQKLKELKLPLVYREFSFKTIGKQVLPVSVRFDELDEFLEFIEKKDEYELFVYTYNKVVLAYPSLKDEFIKKPFTVLEYLSCWDRFLEIIEFFTQTKKPNIYIRELNIKNVDTKFIEKYKKILDILLSNILHVEPLKSLSNYAFEKRYNLKYPLPQVRFRILDESLRIFGLSDLSLTCKEFDGLNLECKKVFIVENKITFLSFFDTKDAIVIFGAGYGVSVLKNAEWLRDKELYYWGDIDEDGFAILSQIRGYFSYTKSIFMNEETIEKFKDLKVVHNIQQKERNILNLTKDEMTIYERLKNDFYGKNFRLEQEKIPFDYVTKESFCLSIFKI
jgi:hypothetical protein